MYCNGHKRILLKERTNKYSSIVHNINTGYNNHDIYIYFSLEDCEFN